MTHQFDSGLFVNSALNKEFHSLGNVVAEAPKDTAEAMRLAGMSWTVEESPVITYGDQDVAPALIGGWKVLRRSDTKGLLNVCRNSWTPLQNSEAFAWFDPIIADGDVEISAAVSLKGGKRIAITAKIKGGIGEVVKGDPIESFLLLFNSHDGSLGQGFKFTHVRPVCANTLAQSLQGEKVRATHGVNWSGKTATTRHTKSILENMKAVRDALDIQERTFRYSIEEYRAMAKVDMSAAAFDRYLSTVFAKQLEGSDRTVRDLKQYEQLVQNFDGGAGAEMKGVHGTLWGAYNAVTEWTTHQRTASSDVQDLESVRNRLDSLWFGSSAQVNDLAHKVALATV